MSYESRKAMRKAEQNQKALRKELELDRYLRVDEDPFPSKRVFKLLKNVDLETVSFDNVQNAGNPMYIEKLNRQELFDLCLVNFARLCVVQEWDGLLSSGGGGGGEGIGAIIPQANIGTSYTRHVVTHYPITGNTTASQSTIATTNSPMSRPFVAPQTGDIAEVGCVIVGSAVNAMRIGIFSDSEMAPHELLGYADIDTGSTGSIYQTSWSSIVETERGTVYHAMWVRTDSGSSPSCVAESNGGLQWTSASSGVASYANQQACLQLSGSDNDLEATVTKTNLSPTYSDPLRISLKYA